MRKSVRLFSVGVVVAVLGLVLSACAPKATPTPGVPTSTPKPTAPAEFTLRVADWSSPADATRSGEIWFMDEMEKQSKGRVVFERYWVESLVKQVDQMSALKDGLISMGVITASWFPDKNPYNSLFSLPIIAGQHTGMQATLACDEMSKKNPGLLAEADRWGIHYLFTCTAGDGSYLMSKRLIRSIEDMKGLRVRTAGKYNPLVAKAWGMSSITVAYAEIYDAINRGAADACFMSDAGSIGISLHEVAPNVMLYGTGASTGLCVYIGKGTWNKLPPDIQNLMSSLALPAMKYEETALAGSKAIWLKQCKDKGGIIWEPSEAEKQQLNLVEVAKVVVEMWEKDAASYGVSDPAALMKEYLDLLEKMK